MSTLRGRGRTLEIAIDRELPAAAPELREQFAARPGFYRGSHAVANLGGIAAGRDEIVALCTLLDEFGITLDGVSGEETLAPVLAELELAYLGASPLPEVSALPRERSLQSVELSAAARSLVADFAGARADLAKRRQVAGTAQPDDERPPVAAAGGVTIPPIPREAPAGVSTLYHRGTLRGGQALHNLGNIVLVGDVNPGAELIASGDIVVVGALRGTAHAGAQGDRAARVIALTFAPTQLRIATMIGADSYLAEGAQQAVVEGDRIAVGPLDGLAGRREANV